MWKKSPSDRIVFDWRKYTNGKKKQTNNQKQTRDEKNTFVLCVHIEMVSFIFPANQNYKITA